MVTETVISWVNKLFFHICKGTISRDFFFTQRKIPKVGRPKKKEKKKSKG